MTALTLSSLSRSLGLSPRGRTVAGGAAPTIVAAGLIAEWRFDDGAGQLLADYSGNGRHGQLGGTVGADVNDPAWTAQGLSFDGVNDYVQLPSLPQWRSITIVLKPTATITTASSSRQLLGRGNDAHNGFKTGSVTASLTNELVTAWDETSGTSRSAWGGAGEQITAGWHLLQADRDEALPARWRWTFDGTDKPRIVNTAPKLWAAAAWKLCAAGAGTSAWAGSIAFLAMHSGPMDAAQRAQNNKFAHYLMSGRGVTLP